MSFDLRLQKQLIVIIIYLLIFALIGCSIYYFWFRQRPSCFDNIKNQAEEGIDCGGPCISCEIKIIKNIETIWIKAFLIQPLDFAQGKTSYDLAAQIKNPNANYGAEKLSYEFTLYDEANNLILSKKGVTFILSNETKYIIEPAVSVQKPVAKIKLAVTNPQWSKLKDFEFVRGGQLFIKDKQYEPHGSITGFDQVSGIVKNESPFDFDRVTVNIVLFDKEGQPIGVNKTEIRTLLNGEGRYFAANWFSPIENEVTSVDAVAETDVFLNENFMKRYGTPAQFKELPGPARK